jgi:hypothetical protein
MVDAEVGKARQEGAVLCEPHVKALTAHVTFFLSHAHVNLSDAGWYCMAERAAGHCNAGEAALIQVLQHTQQYWVNSLTHLLC